MNDQKHSGLTVLMYGILETGAEREFDDIAVLASQLCSTPIALVSFAAGDRHWFKSRVGFEACETDSSISVCRFVVESGQPLVIPDLTLDPRTADNPQVTPADGIRFYAGQPLRTKHGVIGALCVIDRVPRPDGLSDRLLDCLAALSRLAVDRLEARRMAMKYEQALAAIRND